jgi:hypothetical protein
MLVIKILQAVVYAIEVMYLHLYNLLLGLFLLRLLPRAAVVKLLACCLVSGVLDYLGITHAGVVGTIGVNAIALLFY